MCKLKRVEYGSLALLAINLGEGKLYSHMTEEYYIDYDINVAVSSELTASRPTVGQAESSTSTSSESPAHAPSTRSTYHTKTEQQTLCRKQIASQLHTQYVEGNYSNSVTSKSGLEGLEVTQGH